MLKKPLAAADPMELLKQNMAALASSSVSFFGIRDERSNPDETTTSTTTKTFLHTHFFNYSNHSTTKEKEKSPRNTKIVSKGCKLVGCGSAVSSLQVSNDDLAKVVDTSDEWISVRTGICNRRVLTDKLVHEAKLYRTS